MTEARTYMDGYSDGKEWAQADMLRTVEPMTAAGVDAALARLAITEEANSMLLARNKWLEHTLEVAGASPVEPNFCESCAMGLSTCDCVTPRPVFVNQLPSAQPSESAEHWHSLYIKKCQELHDEKARLGAEIETLELAAIDDAERYAVPPSQALSLDLLERLSKTLTRLGYATPEGGMEHFNADLANQLYSLCRAVDSLFDREQPPAPSEAAITYMTGYSDGREWAQQTTAAGAVPCGKTDYQSLLREALVHFYHDGVPTDSEHPKRITVNK